MTRVAKRITITKRSEYFFDDDCTGICFPEDGEIFVKEFVGSTILHELIHALEMDPLTHEAIAKVWLMYFRIPVDEMMKDEEFVKHLRKAFARYSEEDLPHELFAYWLTEAILEVFEDDGKDAKQAINNLINYVEANSNVWVFLTFATDFIEDINIKSKYMGEFDEEIIEGGL